MRVSAEQIINGITQYADGEVIAKLPTMGKWMLGAGIGVASNKINDIVHNLNDNTIIKMMGIIDESGMYDLDLVAESLKQSAQKYGKMTIEVPLIGKLSFNDSDIDTLRAYIERG